MDYESNENASIVYAALAIDKEVIHHDPIPKIILCSFNFIASSKILTWIQFLNAVATRQSEKADICR